MKEIDPVELSGFIDREMTEERSEEVRQLVANDASLQEELKSLSRADLHWRDAARSAAFRVEIPLHRDRVLTISTAQAAPLIAFLLAIRFLPRLVSSLTLGFALNGIGLALVIACVIALSREKPING
jgi:hypothetical protein